MNYFELLSISEFQQPVWFWLLLIPLVKVIFYYYSANKNLPERHFDPDMRYWYINHNKVIAKTRIKLIVIELIFWAALAIVLAGPATTSQQVYSRATDKSPVTLILLDASASMNASDVQPSRFLRAKNELLLLVDKLKPGQRLGIILFSAKSHLLAPPTYEKTALRFYINSIQPNMLPFAGSVFEDAIINANNYLEINNESKNSSIILITDGDNQQPERTLKILKSRSINYSVSVLGIGKQVDTPVPAFDNDAQWLYDDAKPVYSSLNAKLLKKIANNHHGFFTTISDNKTKLASLVVSSESSKAKKDRHINVEWTQLYHPFLLLALLMFFIKAAMQREN